MYKQKDIIFIPFPYTDLTASKLRPALILSNTSLQHDFICCLITSQPTTQGIALPDILPFESWIKPHRLFTVHKSIIVKKLSSISQIMHQRVLTHLHTYLK